jgi:hypothetical protein
MESFTYSPFTEPQKQIRLLELLPGAGTGAIQCHLRHVSLDSAPAYEAISYTWGDDTVTNSIQIGGKNFVA